MIKITLPSQLASFAGGKKTLEVEASDLAGVFGQLDSIAPMLRSQMFHADGSLRQFIGLFLDGRQVLAVNTQQVVQPGSTLLVIMSVAGG